MKLLIIPITLLLASASTFGKTTIVLTTHNLPPYSHYIGKMLSGSAVEVVECAFKPMSEYTLQIKVVPWKRAQTLVIQNEADGFFAASKNPTRDDYATMSEIIAEQNWTWFQRKDNYSSPTGETFRTDKVVSSFLGANMQTWLTSNEYQLANNPPRNNQQLLQLLIRKRVDAILANDQVINKLLTTNHVEHLVRSDTLRSKPLGVYFSHNFLDRNPGFIQRFNQNVRTCRQ